MLKINQKTNEKHQHLYECTPTTLATHNDNYIPTGPFLVHTTAAAAAAVDALAAAAASPSTTNTEIKRRRNKW